MFKQTEVDVDFSNIKLFSDEAYFHLTDFFNNQNCRIWAIENLRAIFENPKHPQKVTDRCTLYAGEIFGPYFLNKMLW